MHAPPRCSSPFDPVYNRWHARRLVENGYAITGAAIPVEIIAFHADC